MWFYSKYYEQNIYCVREALDIYKKQSFLNVYLRGLPMFTQNDNLHNNKCMLQRKNAEYFMSCVIKPKSI